jgi:hypothetical protein
VFQSIMDMEDVKESSSDLEKIRIVNSIPDIFPDILTETGRLRLLSPETVSSSVP